MKKIISVITASALLFTTNFIYADNKEKDLNKELNENRQEQSSVKEKIQGLDANIKEIEENIEKTNGKIEILDSEIDETQSQMKALKENIAENEEFLGQRLKVMNNNYSMGYIKVILSSTSLSDFFDNMYIVKQVVDQDKKVLQELEENKVDVQDKEEELNEKKTLQEDLKTSLESDSEKVEADKSELEALKRDLESQEDKMQEELEQIALEAAKQREVELAAQGGVSSDDSLNGAIISSGSWPVPGYSRVSSPYGYRTHPVLQTQKMHTGIDIPAPTGTPVVSVDNGKVIYSGVQGSYGNTVMIQHDDGKVSLYAHNSQLLVSVGQSVQKGQAIAKVGSTGMSTGPHLHFEIRINGKHTNPLPYI